MPFDDYGDRTLSPNTLLPVDGVVMGMPLFRSLSADPGLIASSLSCCLPVGKSLGTKKVDMSDPLPMGNVGPRFLISTPNKGEKLCSSLVKWRFNSGSMSRQIAKVLVVYSSPYESWAKVLLSPFNSLAALGLFLGLSCDFQVSSPGRVVVLPAANHVPCTSHNTTVSFLPWRE
jgi:hypothetical protein